ncbi:MucBP domain-containing protein [Carnobacterium divergens]|uniref:MucBP domain-containing protein n=1 Tax=Carnobacterium divergens TaxID=2748 RepID=A0AAW8REL0_CARDV|nr:MucBP domain-containing protein [Carnobacterium divergens]MDT1958743.1 MucBP domain-containing protein [Carnobacterium divergens]MDT1974623.1 MucBP domain-containing protein [Carnobacterium divergens]
MKKKYLLLSTILLILSSFNMGISVLADGLSNDEGTRTVSYSTAPTDDLRHVSNMFVDPGFKYIAYNGSGELHMYLYSSEKTQYLSNMYIVLPSGLTANGGLEAVQTALALYSNELNIVNGSLTAKQLPNTNDGREVYQVTPTSGAYIEKDGHSESLVLKFPIKVGSKDSGLTEIVFNADTKEDIRKNILFIGTDNIKFDASIAFYPEITANEVGIDGDDGVVRGIVLNGIHRSINLFSPQVQDNYTVYEQGTNSVLATKDKIGISEDNYSRIGLVDNLSVLGLDSTIYDENSLTIDSGTLSDTVEWIPQNALTNDPNEIMKGNEYSIYVKRYAKDITVNYVDENNNKISDSVILSGDIGDSYATEQKGITGYTFKEVKGNATGTFTDQEQEVTYVYTKNLVKASPITVHYVDTKGTKLSDDILLEGNVGDSYTTEQKAMNGYTLKEVKGNATGTFTDQEQEVTYVYTKNPVKSSPVTVHYVDTEGTKLSDDILLEGNVGDSYTTEQKAMNGYTLKEVKGNATGTFTNEEQEVTYVYDKAQVNPIVPPSENNNKPEDNNTNEEHSIDSSQNENDGTQFPQTGEQVVSNMWGYVGFALLVSSVFMFIKRKKA